MRCSVDLSILSSLPESIEFYSKPAGLLTYSLCAFPLYNSGFLNSHFPLSQKELTVAGTVPDFNEVPF